MVQQKLLVKQWNGTAFSNRYNLKQVGLRYKERLWTKTGLSWGIYRSDDENARCY